MPPRSFYSLAEIAARWSVTAFDLVGWCTEGLLALSIALPPVKAGAEIISGLADVEGPHVFPLFRRDGAPSATVAIRQVRIQEHGLRWITEPVDGLVITGADVLVRRSEAERPDHITRHALLVELAYRRDRTSTHAGARR